MTNPLAFGVGDTGETVVEEVIGAVLKVLAGGEAEHAATSPTAIAATTKRIGSLYTLLGDG